MNNRIRLQLDLRPETKRRLDVLMKRRGVKQPGRVLIVSINLLHRIEALQEQGFKTVTFIKSDGTEVSFEISDFSDFEPNENSND